MTPYPILAALLLSATLPALEYARKPADPQPSGWPLTAESPALAGRPDCWVLRRGLLAEDP